jgi:hypothetical protein
MKVKDSGVKAWVRGQRKSQVLGAFGLLCVTMLRPVLAWRAFGNLWTVYFFNFPIFFSGRGKPRILNQWIRGRDSTLLLATCWNADPNGDAIFHRTKIKIDGPNHVRDKEYIRTYIHTYICTPLYCNCNTGWSKCLYALDYSTQNTQKYFKLFQSLTMIT